MKHRITCLTTVLAASACLLYAAVRTDFDHHSDFSRFHTYSWIGVRAGNSLWQDRIQSAVDRALAAKGWTKVESGGDAAVSAFGRTRERDTLQTFYDGFPGWGWQASWWGMGMGMGESTTQVVPERVGSLTVDIFDGQSKHLIFRGESSNTLTDKPEKNDKKLQHSVDEMFEKFPPRERG